MLASFSLTSFLPIWFARGNLHGPSEPFGTEQNSRICGNALPARLHERCLCVLEPRHPRVTAAPPFQHFCQSSQATGGQERLGSLTGGTPLGLPGKRSRTFADGCVDQIISLLNVETTPGQTWSRVDVCAPCYVGMLGALLSLPLLALMLLTQPLGPRCRDTWSLLYAAGSAGFILGTAWLCCRWRARLAANGFIQSVLLLQRDPRVGISPYALGGCAATAPAQVVPDIAVVPLDRKDWKHICSK